MMVTSVMSVRDNRIKTAGGGNRWIWDRQAGGPRIRFPKHMLGWVRTLPGDQTLGLVGTCRSRSPTSRGIVTCSVDSSFVLSGYLRHGEIQGTDRRLARLWKQLTSRQRRGLGLGLQIAACRGWRWAKTLVLGACVSDSALPAEASYMPVQVSIVLVCITEGPCCNANRMR